MNQFVGELTTAACPICDHDSRRLFMKHGYWVRSCKICRHQFAEISPSIDHIDRIYSDQYFQGGGVGYPDYLSEARILRARGRSYSRLLARFMKPGIFLDVGAAAGFILQGFIDNGWNGSGIEPNPRMANYARTCLGLRVATGSIEQFQSKEHYDLVSMLQVVAHFTDLRRALQTSADVTRPGGFWLIETWNCKSWTARIFGQRWHEYSPPSVLQWFSPESLRQLSARYGFLEVARGRATKWISSAHANALLQYKLGDSRLGRLASRVLSVIPGRLVIPYVMDDLFWALFQKS